MKIILFLMFIVLSFSLFSQGNKKARTIYKYKQYEKFDLDEISMEGDTGSPGDLSIRPRYERLFRNNLPYRKNFNPEIKRSIERIR